MTRHRFQRRTPATALALVALASCGLTACGSYNRASSVSPQQAAAIQARRHAAAMELFDCARRHGIHLPRPTAAGINVHGVKGRSHEVAISNCYHKALKKAEREVRAEREGGLSSTPGEESSSG